MTKDQVVSKSANKDPATDSSKKSIIEAARVLFIERGFAGASISAIAKQAAVTRSLIFHHFGNKQQLWDAVKQQLQIQAGTDFEQKIGSLKNLSQSKLSHPEQVRQLLQHFVAERFEFYLTQKDYFRLLCWQILDKQAIEHAPSEQSISQQCEQIISALQHAGCIRADINAAVLTVAVLGSVYAPFVLQHAMPLTSQQKQQYLQLMLQSLEVVLADQA